MDISPAISSLKAIQLEAPAIMRVLRMSGNIGGYFVCAGRAGPKAPCHLHPKRENGPVTGNPALSHRCGAPG